MIIFDATISGTLELENPISGSLTDAPSDGKTYGRKDGSWVEFTGTGTSTFNLIYSAETSLISFSRTDVLSIVTVP